MNTRDCALCNDLKGLVGKWDHWLGAMNRNQNLPGKTMAVLRRHCTDVTELTSPERDELWAEVVPALRSAITAAVSPAHFNYMFLMNQDAHVHLHVVPRRTEAVSWLGQEFLPVDSLEPPPVFLPNPQLASAAESLRVHIPALRQAAD